MVLSLKYATNLSFSGNFKRFNSGIPAASVVKNWTFSEKFWTYVKSFGSVLFEPRTTRRSKNRSPETEPYGSADFRLFLTKNQFFSSDYGIFCGKLTSNNSRIIIQSTYIWFGWLNLEVQSTEPQGSVNWTLGSVDWTLRFSRLNLPKNDWNTLIKLLHLFISNADQF